MFWVQFIWQVERIIAKRSVSRQLARRGGRFLIMPERWCGSWFHLPDGQRRRHRSERRSEGRVGFFSGRVCLCELELPRVYNGKGCGWLEELSKTTNCRQKRGTAMTTKRRVFYALLPLRGSHFAGASLRDGRFISLSIPTTRKGRRRASISRETRFW